MRQARRCEVDAEAGTRWQAGPHTRRMADPVSLVRTPLPFDCGLGFRGWGSGFMVQSRWYMMSIWYVVYGKWYMVNGMWYGVWGVGFRL